MSEEQEDTPDTSENNGAPRARPSGSTGSALLGNAAWLSVALLLPQFYTLAISVGAARFLGPADMGRQSYISFVAATATMLAALGLPTAIQRFTATADGAGKRGEVSAFALLAWKASPVSAAIAFTAVMVVSTTAYPDLRTAWILAAFSSAFTAMHSLSSNVLFGLRRYLQATIVGVSVGGLGVVATLVALGLGYGITGVLAVQAAAAGLITLGTVWLCLRAVRPYLGASTSLAGRRRDVGRFTIAIGLTLVIDVVVSKRSEFFFLEAFSANEQIAFYSVAFAAAAAVQRLPTALVEMVVSQVSALAGAGEHDRIATGYSRSVRLLVIVVLPLTSGVMALGPLAIRIAYGESYAEAGPVLVILAPVVLLLASLAAVATAALNALGRIRAPVVWGLFALSVTIGMDFLLIPRFGALGAAVANNGGLIASSVALVIVADRQIGARWLRASLGRSLGASVLAGAASYAAAASLVPTSTVAALLLGMTVYGLVFLGWAMTIRIFDADDALWLREALSHRVEPLARVVDRMTRRQAGGARPTA